ncbi:Competence protein CoiA-like family protein [compost metagenome]
MEFGLDKITRKRITPKSGVQAICQSCGQDLISKCGNIRIHHWAHKQSNCDHWWESETEWHRNWKNKFPDEWREVIKFDMINREKHIADIYNPAKELVIEFQNSPIKKEELESREQFYQKMIWVVNAYNMHLELMPLELIYQDIAKSEKYFLSEPVNNALKIPDRIYNYLIQHRDKLMQKMRAGSFEAELCELAIMFDKQFDNVVREYSLDDTLRFEGTKPFEVKKDLIAPIVLKATVEIDRLTERNKQLDEKNQYYKYNWSARKKVWDYSKMNVFLDTGPELLWILTSSIIKKVPKEKFISKYCKS